MTGFKSLLAGAAVFALSCGFASAEDTIRLGMTPEPYMPFTQVNAGGE